MKKSIGDVCLEIARYAQHGNHDLLNYVLKIAASEAYRIQDDDPRWGEQPELGFFDLDVASDTVFGDAVCAKFFGAKPKATISGIPNANFIHSLHPEDRDRVLLDVAEAITNGLPFDCRYRLVPNDRLRWIHARGFCARDSAGKPTRFTGIVNDITSISLL
jgi:PAS domain-containing protein